MAIETLGRADVQTRIRGTNEANIDTTYNQDGDVTYDIEVTSDVQYTNPTTRTGTWNENSIDNETDANATFIPDHYQRVEVTVDYIKYANNIDADTQLEILVSNEVIISESITTPTTGDTFSFTYGGTYFDEVRIDGHGDATGVDNEEVELTVTAYNDDDSDGDIQSVTQSDGV